MIKNKKILITGNTSGLGFALTDLLLKKGNRVFSLSKRFLKKRENLRSQVCNLANLNSIDKALNRLLKTKKLDYVFLNAGILGKIDLMKNIKFIIQFKLHLLIFFGQKMSHPKGNSFH